MWEGENPERKEENSSGEMEKTSIGKETANRNERRRENGKIQQNRELEIER